MSGVTTSHGRAAKPPNVDRVDGAAGLPQGSTSNQFRTREALVAGVLSRLVEVEIAAWSRLAERLRPDDVAGFTRVFGQLIRELTTSGRVVALARQALFIEAAVQPDLQRQDAIAALLRGLLPDRPGEDAIPTGPGWLS